MAYHADHMALSAMPAADRRAALFRESLADKVARWTLGTAWALMPGRISGLPNLARLCARELLAPDYSLHDPEHALANSCTICRCRRCSPPVAAGSIRWRISRR